MKKNEVLGAHFASSEEIEKEFSQNSGCILGKFNDSYLIDSSYRNLLLLAPTGAGKGVSFVIPNLLSWTESAIIYDIKLENFELTSGYRQNVLKQNIFVWSLGSKNTNSYNPLDYVLKDGQNIVKNIKNLLSFLLPKDEYLEMEAKNILTSIIIYLSNSDSKNVNFGNIYRIVENKNFFDYLGEILKNKSLDYFVENNVARFLKKSDEEKLKIVSIILNALDLWSDPMIDNATKKSDFDILSFSNKAQTLYVGVEPKNIEIFKPLFQMFYYQYLSENVNINTDKLAGDKRIGTLVVLDEFLMLGKMNYILDLLPYTRGYKLKLCIIAQNLEQIRFIYGESGVDQVISNSIKVIYNNGANTANYLSKMIGNEIIMDGDNIKTTKPLVLPQEIVDSYKELKEFIITQESKVIKCDKVKYFMEKDFKDRVLEKAVIKSVK